MKLSVVISVFNEELILKDFYAEILNILENNHSEYELIFVNDGSTDRSGEIIDLLAINNKVKAIHFSTNFGHEAAMIAGVDYATGDAIICMDSDVDIINMVSKQSNNKQTAKIFYKTLNLISQHNLTVNASDFFLISARVAEILRKDYRERVRFLRGFIQIIGFKKATIEFEIENRKAGKSKYSFHKLVSLSVTAIATLSKLPLKVGIFMGLLSGLFSLFVAIYSIIMKFIDQPVSGYTTIIVFLGVMFSIQFFILGIIGEYIGFLFDEQKKRPIYIIDKTSNLTQAK
jgi:dolichol-phosphate mannosyltransferase